MSSPPFVAVNAREVLSRHGLDSFAALWALALSTVEKDTREGAGWSSVHRLELTDVNGDLQCFYLKRQENHCTRTLKSPLGEPTFAREFRAAQQYARLGIPALEAAFFACREEQGQRQAILMTRALDGYASLDQWYEGWQQLPLNQSITLIQACGALVRALHNAGITHNRLHPQHVFLRLHGDGAGARLIDLENTHRAWFAQHSFIRDLDVLNRYSEAPTRTQRLRFVLAYMGQRRLDADSKKLVRRLVARRASKEAKK
ncbi:MAG: lipopolysaccharide kinase InaA family protein [Halopseudomonas sp.]|uniref:lipopolysaccharide kinase InaA family protein n=1 Tax=Halopseudomonas sp. TaxID=2901191 RepID=UPI003003360A